MVVLKLKIGYKNSFKIGNVGCLKKGCGSKTGNIFHNGANRVVLKLIIFIRVVQIIR